MKSEESDRTLQAWETSSAYWDKYRAVIEQMFAPVTTALIEEADISRGIRVVDIGGGSGEPSLTISGVVGPTGAVMYTDPASGMVQSARAEAERRHLTNIEFRQCSAGELPFDSDSFDAAVARFSVMFFADPLTGVREALRVTRNGGRVVFAVWASRDVNPFFSTTADVLERLVGVPASEPDTPDPFRFAVSGKLVGILEDAGAKDVVERQLAFQIEAPISLEQFWQLRTEMSETLRETVRSLTGNQIQRIKEEVCEAARKYFASDSMSFPAQALIVSGKA